MALSVFPALIGIAFPARRTVNWSGSRQDSLSGKRVRTSNFSYPTYSYELPINFLRGDAVADWQALEGFLKQTYGPTSLWLYSDRNDSNAAAQEFGLGDGVTTAFQLVRTLGGFAEPVFFPTITSVTVAGVPTAAYTLSPTGQVIFNAPPAPAAVLQWTGTFYWGCRFDDDSTDFENFLLNFFRLKSLKFSTEKL